MAVALGNWLASVDHPPGEAVTVLRDALSDEEPLVRRLTVWALVRASRKTALMPRRRTTPMATLPSWLAAD